MGHLAWQCMSLHNFLLALRNSSLACGCSSIAIQEALIFAIRHAWFSRVSSQKRSWSAIASSRIYSCSHQYSVFFSWKALMASIFRCKAGASPPSDPFVLCVVLLITLDCSAVNAGGFKYYRAPRWVPNVFAC